MTENKITQEQLNERMKYCKKSFKQMLKTHPPNTSSCKDFVKSVKIGMALIEQGIGNEPLEIQKFGIDNIEETLSFYKHYYSFTK